MEDEIETIISISDGLNLVSRHRGQPLAARSPQPGPERFPNPTYWGMGLPAIQAEAQQDLPQQDVCPQEWL